MRLGIVWLAECKPDGALMVISWPEVCDGVHVELFACIWSRQGGNEGYVYMHVARIDSWLKRCWPRSLPEVLGDCLSHISVETRRRQLITIDDVTLNNGTYFGIS